MECPIVSSHASSWVMKRGLTTLPNAALMTRQENPMRRILTFTGILSVLCCSVFAQSKVAASGGTEEAVMRIERELLDAVLKGNASANERYLADTYVFTGPDG